MHDGHTNYTFFTHPLQLMTDVVIVTYVKTLSIDLCRRCELNLHLIADSANFLCHPPTEPAASIAHVKVRISRPHAHPTLLIYSSQPLCCLNLAFIHPRVSIGTVSTVFFKELPASVYMVFFSEALSKWLGRIYKVQ